MVERITGSFDLHQHIRQILGETREENLDALVTMVYDATPDTALREAYRQALPDVIRHRLAETPRAPRTAQPDQALGDTHRRSVGLGQDTTGGSHSPFETQSTAAPSGGQNLARSRVARFRAHRFRLNVWIGGGTYRPILECTAENLDFAAAESDRQAEANRAAAWRYRKLAKVMRDRAAETVGDLTDAEIEEVLGSDA